MDSNIYYSTLDIFKELNLEALHARDVGLSRATDKEIIDYAIMNKLVLITKDLEFANRKVFSLEDSQGIILLRLPFFFKVEQVKKVLKDFLTSIKLKDIEKSLIIIKLGRYRIRKI